jgi:DNA-binding SARP family transcriptional activator
VPVARLCAALWPEAEGDAARNSFDNALHRLRKLLGGDTHVQLRAGGLGLDATTCWTDLAALEACFAEVDALAPDATMASVSALAERSLVLYPGEFLAGEEDLPDVLVARARIQARFTRQMGALGARLEALGQHAAAARVYERVVEQQPLAEDIYRRLITCLLAQGQRAEAYEVYRRCRQQLSVVLGMRPAPETDALVASLRNL